MSDKKTRETPYGLKWRTKDLVWHTKWFASMDDRGAFIISERPLENVKKNNFRLLK